MIPSMPASGKNTANFQKGIVKNGRGESVFSSVDFFKQKWSGEFTLNSEERVPVGLLQGGVSYEL